MNEDDLLERAGEWLDDNAVADYDRQGSIVLPFTTLKAWLAEFAGKVVREQSIRSA